MEHLYLDHDDSLVGVIDFGDAAVSDPAYDFAKIGRELGSEFGSSLLRHYGRPGDASFQSRIDLYERLELLWQVARPDASDSERDASLRLLASLCEIGA
jgi:aminoglycoside phosphotransferase (APT) family kinase protein